MRVLLDTNILLSALLARGTSPDNLYEAWRAGRFDLVSCERQLDEFRRVCRRPFFAERVTRGEFGRIINAIRRLAVMREPAPMAAVSSDPDDDYLLAIAEAAEVDFIVTGDKAGLLALQRHGRTRIVTARDMLGIMG